MEKEAAQSITLNNTPTRTFENHEKGVPAVAVFPDRQRMVTTSVEGTLHLWNLKDGVPLKKMEGHHSWVLGVALPRDGRMIASGDENGEVIAWDGNTGESLVQTIKAHSTTIYSLDFSPDGTVLATGSFDQTTKLWNTETWELLGNPIDCGYNISCVRYSPSGEHLVIATFKDFQIYEPGTRECIAKFKGHASSENTVNSALAWTPDGTRLLSAGYSDSNIREQNPTISEWDNTIREWDPSTWQQVGKPWEGHTDGIVAIAVNHAGTLVASASIDKHVRLWRLSDRRTIAIFQHSYTVACVTFSIDDKHILTGSVRDTKIIEWAVPEDALLEDTSEEHDSGSNKDIPRITNEVVHHSLQYSQPSQSQPQQRTERLVTVRSLRSAPPPPPPPPTALSSPTAPITLKTRIRHLFAWRPNHAASPVADVGKLRNAATGAPSNDHDLISDEYFDDPPQANSQQQPAAAQITTREHGSSWTCCCF